ncbi:hypothetical protein BC829DRAFT_387499 [Chytridium lagenaria]|nr:hypothetical protein BC829DRAFT_387499 [Chytridium lagenaria]
MGRNETSGAVGLLPRNYLDIESAVPAATQAGRSPSTRTASLAVKRGNTQRNQQASTPAAASASAAAPVSSVPLSVQAINQTVSGGSGSSEASSAAKSKEVLVGICDYTAQNSDEANLKIGDRVSILYSYEDGWVLGTNETTGAVGLLPRNFLDVESKPQADAARTPSSSGPYGNLFNDPAAPPMPTPAAVPLPLPLQLLLPLQLPLLYSSPSTYTTPSSSSSSNIPTSLPVVSAPASAATPKPYTPPTQYSSQSIRAAATNPPPAAAAIKFEAVLGTPSFVQATTLKLSEVNAARGNRSRVGANMGQLKIMVAGDLAIGKTSPLRPPPPAAASGSIREIRASTIPAAEIFEGEERLNLTFVDTPGYGSAIDALSIVRPVVEYCASQYGKTEKAFVKGVRLGVRLHVDVVFYGILHRLTPIDLEYIRRLERIVTVREILERLGSAGVRVYGFGLSHEECVSLAKGSVWGAVPFAISTEENVGGGKEKARNEFEELKTAVLYHHVNDLRTLSAEKFANWWES